MLATRLQFEKQKINREKGSFFHLLTQPPEERQFILCTSYQVFSVKKKKGEAFEEPHHAPETILHQE